MNNKTRDDARARSVQASMGCLAGNPSLEFLIAFRADLCGLIQRLDNAIAEHSETVAHLEEYDNV